VNFNNQHLFLIADIDRVLTLTGNPEEIGHETEKVLHKVRSFLADYKPLSPAISNDVAQQIAQAVISEIDVKRSEWLQPLQLEINELNHHRQSILKEIRQLETQRQEIIADFLEVLMERFQKSLEAKINKTLKDATYQLLSQKIELDNVGDIPSFADISTEYLGQLQQFQQESDQLLQSLDLTFRTVFESLKRDLNTYENALSNGLARIYNLGEQSETAIKDYFVPIAEDNTQILASDETEKITNLSNDENVDLEGKKTLEKEEDWINNIIEPLALKEEPEIRPLLEIDIENPPLPLDTGILSGNKKEDKSEALLFDSEEVESEKKYILNLTFDQNFSDPEKTAETILFGEKDKGFEPEKPLAYSSLEEILFNESSFVEEGEAQSEQNLSSIKSENQAKFSSKSPEELKQIDTIKLLTDLLEEGALDNIENEEELREYEQDDHEILMSEKENLLPNLEEEKTKTPDLKENLTPDKLEELAQDLAIFGGEIISEETELKIINFPSPWDDLAKE